MAERVVTGRTPGKQKDREVALETDEKQPGLIQVWVRTPESNEGGWAAWVSADELRAALDALRPPNPALLAPLTDNNEEMLDYGKALNQEPHKGR